MRTACTARSGRLGGARRVQRLAVSRVQASSSQVLITGGNTGIGYETALSLCRQGYAVTIACRDDAKADAAAQRIKAAVPSAAVDTWHLDLADLGSVRTAAQQWLDSGRPLDVLINNAGVMACPQMTTKDGFEYQLGVNHLGHFLLTSLLLPRIRENAGPVRVINVSSAAHYFGRVDLEDPMLSRGGYDRWKAYAQSKLANVLFTYELARRLPQATVNCLHPGVVRTELSRYLMKDGGDDWLSNAFKAVMTPFTLTPEQGAATSIYLASSPEVQGLSAKYFDSCKPMTSSPASYDQSTAMKLWDLSCELTQP